MSNQIPPADELYAVREQLRALGDREKILRALMLVDPSARNGNLYAVEIKDVQTTRTDLVEMRKMHPDIVEQYTFKVTNQRVELRAVTEDGELTRIKRGKETTDAK